VKFWPRTPGKLASQASDWHRPHGAIPWLAQRKSHAVWRGNEDPSRLGSIPGKEKQKDCFGDLAYQFRGQLRLWISRTPPAALGRWAGYSGHRKAKGCLLECPASTLHQSPPDLTLRLFVWPSWCWNQTVIFPGSALSPESPLSRMQSISYSLALGRGDITFLA
jgi:hypothetical protein